MSEWKEYKIKNITKRITSGGTPSTKIREYYGGEIPWLNTKEIGFNRITDTEVKITEAGLNNSSAKWIEPNSIIVAMYGATAGKIAINKIPLTTNQACCNLTINGEIANYNFVYYYLCNSYDELKVLASGAAQQNLNVGIISDFIIFLPPLPEQRAIAFVLSSLDDKIDLLHRENKTLEAMAETLFRQWFVEEAKDEWEDAKLGEVVTITYGKNLPIKKLLKSGYPVFGGNGQIGFYNKYLYVEPQVLVSCRGEASGKVNISLPRSFITNNSLILVRDKRKEITFEYLKYHSLNYDFTLHISGSAQPQITIDNLYDAAFLIPPVDLINKFTEVVRGCEEKRANNLKQIHTLEKLRDTLLPKLMSGEVRVKYEEEEMASCRA